MRYIPIEQVRRYNKEGGMVFINGKYQTADMLADLTGEIELRLVANNSICSISLSTK